MSTSIFTRLHHVDFRQVFKPPPIKIWYWRGDSNPYDLRRTF